MQGTHLADYVLDSGLVSLDQLNIARKESRKTGNNLQDSLLKNGFLTPSLLRDVQCEISGRETIDLTSLVVDKSALQLITAEVARRYTLLPISITEENKLKIAMLHAHDVLVLDSVSNMLDSQYELEICIASEQEIHRAIDEMYGVELSIETILEKLGDGKECKENSETVFFGSPVIKLVDALLNDAVRRGASDLHFEPESNFLRIRYRIDGVLQLIRSIHKDYWASTLVRLKILCNLDISETRAPQDGRMSVAIAGRDIDLRISSFPTVHGESLVLRILDRSAALLPMNTLGLHSTDLSRIRALIRKPQGLILVSGPTGSGKSTTLYSIVNDIRDEAINIVTMEDPVEYKLPMVRQCSVNPSLKIDFANGVRSILRQDPDVILVGETRDTATGEMVIRAALTGHLVFTTIHANSALGSLARLKDLGVDPAQMAGNILALVAQRLVRKLCIKCKVPTNEPQIKNTQSTDPGDINTWRAVGCPVCNGVGYKGRQVLMEIYEPSYIVNQMMACGATTGELIEQAMAENHVDLIQRGNDLVASGLTSHQELSRVLNISTVNANSTRLGETDTPDDI